MKKVISIVSFLSVLTLLACRSENDEYEFVEAESSNVIVPEHYFQRDSTADSHSGGNDQEPPRKDLLQWRTTPVKNEIKYSPKP